MTKLEEIEEGIKAFVAHRESGMYGVPAYISHMKADDEVENALIDKAIANIVSTGKYYIDKDDSICRNRNIDKMSEKELLKNIAMYRY